MCIRDSFQNPQNTLNDICHFLNVSPFEIVENGKNKVKNKSALPKNLYLDTAIRKVIRTSRTFSEYIPDNVKKSLSKPIYKMLKKNQKKIDYPPMPAKLKSKLQADFQEDMKYVEALLKRPIVVWDEISKKS